MKRNKPKMDKVTHDLKQDLIRSCKTLSDYPEGYLEKKTIKSLLCRCHPIDRGYAQEKIKSNKINVEQ